MKYFLLFILLLSAVIPVRAEELKLADATGGAPLEVFLRASLELSMSGRMNVEMKRLLPTAALTALAEKKVDAVIIDQRFIRDEKTLPLAAEALVLYVNKVNPAENISKKAAWEILTSPRPSWKEYNNLDFDIQRMTMKLLTPSGTLIRRLFGDREIDNEILKVDSFSAGFAFSNSASLFFAQYVPYPPEEIKMLAVEGIAPDEKSIKSGKYPLTVRYVIACRGEMPEKLQVLTELLKQKKYRRQMTDSGLLILLPE
jgi:hypothetical protein